MSIVRRLTRSLLFRLHAPRLCSTFAMAQAPSQDDRKNRMVWVDLEMTGLDVDKERIIEIACLVTDSELNVIAEGPNLVIHQPDSLLDAMGDWCKEHHGKSGLTEAVRKSNVKTEEAERQVLNFLQQHTDAGAAPLAGNSVYMDRLFLAKYMPTLIQHLHYRIIDVSTLKELCRRWYPKVFDESPEKKLTHRAIDDIKESIEELRYYRKTIFTAAL